MMAQHITLVEAATEQIAQIEQVAAREVQRRYHHRINNADSEQERANLRQFYLKRLLKDNQWHAKATSNRAYYMAAAQMYGIAALVEAQQNLATYEPEVF